MLVNDKIKNSLRKICQIPTLVFIISVSISLFYYGKKFYYTKQLNFDTEDTKILLVLIIMLIWIMVFSVYLMLELNKRNKVIIKQNTHIQDQNKTIQNLLNKVIISNNNIKDNTEDIIEQNEDNFDQLIKAHKNTKIFINQIYNDDRNDDIA